MHILLMALVEIRRDANRSYRQGRLPRSESIAEFLLEFMSSAQYLSVGRPYRYLIQQSTEMGYMVRLHPNTHTIVSRWSPTSELDNSITRNQYVTYVLAQTHSTLRYPVVENSRLDPWEFENPLNNWSTLTHLSMCLMSLHLYTWFSFICSPSTLQSDSFYLGLEDIDIDIFVRLLVCTLPCLTALRMITAQIDRVTEQYLLRAILDNLQFPVLRRLSLGCRAMTWYDFTAITDVYAALASAPTLTTLSLGIYFSAVRWIRMTLQPKIHIRTIVIRSDIEPLSAYVLRLEHLSSNVCRPLRQHLHSTSSPIGLI